MAKGEDYEDLEIDLTVDEFIRLLAYINKKLEVINREASKFQRHTRRFSHGYGSYEDIMRFLLSSAGRTPTTPETETIEEDLEVKARAKELAKKLKGAKSK